MNRKRRVLLCLAGVLGWFVAGCADDPVYDASKVEAFLLENSPASLGALTVAEAMCPDDVALTEGVQFRCQLRAGGERVPVKVRLTDVHGDRLSVRAEPQVPVIAPSAAEAYVLGALSAEVADADIACGSGDPIAALPGLRFTCTLQLGSERNEITLKVIDSDGSVQIAE